jgi:predicted nucleotidyltransferase
MDFDLRAHTHLLVLGGSRAYGIHTAASDVDVKGIAVPPQRYYLGCTGIFEQADGTSEIATFAPDLTDHERAIVVESKLEGSVYELRKFLRLALDANPNILDVLFCRDEEVRVATPIGRAIREHRGLFLSAKCKFTFSGYAAAQLKRVETHRRWLLNPPRHEPTRAEFGLPDRTVIPADQLAAAQSAIHKQVVDWGVDLSGMDDSARIDVQERLAVVIAAITTAVDPTWLAAARTIGMDDNFIELLDRERRYKSARTEFQQHRDWEKNRNPARAAMEASYGYDVKHGAHLVRLLRMGKEILETGEVHVWRGDRDGEELREIRAGAWPYDRLIAWARAQEAELERIYADGAYVVPKQPDRAKVDDLCVEWVRQATRQSD